MIKLSNRLAAVASLVKQGSAVADVGTDHGYISVYLCQSGIAKKVIATDINPKPLSSCNALVKQFNLEKKIEARLSDGLDCVCKNECDTVIIAGMGGELIVDILSRCEYVKNLHLILQPMTHSEVVRKFLYQNGFEINNDLIVRELSHSYNVLDACYTGNVSVKSEVDYYLGNIKDFSDKDYFTHLYNYLTNKSKSGKDYSAVINKLEETI